MNFLCCKEARGPTCCFQYFFAGKEKVSEHLPCDAPQPAASGHSSATPAGQRQTLPVSHTTTLPARTSLLPALPQNRGRGAPPRACSTGIAAQSTPQARPSQHRPPAALTLAAQSQPWQLPVGQLMPEIHNPDGDVHLEEQPWALLASSCRMRPQLHAAL